MNAKRGREYDVKNMIKAAWQKGKGFDDVFCDSKMASNLKANAYKTNDKTSSHVWSRGMDSDKETDIQKRWAPSRLPHSTIVGSVMRCFS